MTQVYKQTKKLKLQLKNFKASKYKAKKECAKMHCSNPLKLKLFSLRGKLKIKDLKQTFEKIKRKQGMMKSCKQ